MQLDTLKTALSRVEKAVGDDPPFSRVRCRGREIIARDRTISATYSMTDDLGCDVLIDYATAVAAVKRMPPDSDVTYDQNGDRLIIRSGRTRAAIVRAPEDVDDIVAISSRTNGQSSIVGRDAYELAAAIVSLLRYQGPADATPQWLSALIQVGDDLMVIGDGSKIIAWTPDRWLTRANVTDVLIPRRFSEQLDSTDDPPSMILVSDTTISAIWEGSASFCTTFMAGSAPASVAALIRNWREPVWPVQDEFRTAAQLVSDLTVGDVTITNKTMSGMSRTGSMTTKSIVDVPDSTSVVVPQASLSVIAKTADRWQVDADNPSPFVAGVVRGLVCTRVHTDG